MVGVHEAFVGQCRVEADDRGQLVDQHVEFVEGVLRRVAVGSDDDTDRVTDEADATVVEGPLRLPLVRHDPQHPVGVGGSGDFVGPEHEVDRRGEPVAANPSHDPVGDGAADDRRVGHAGQLDVVGVATTARQQRAVLEAGASGTDVSRHRTGRFQHRRAHAGHAVGPSSRSTAMASMLGHAAVIAARRLT